MHSKKDKPKPSHSLLSNGVWSARMLIRHTPAAFLLYAFGVPVSIASQYLDIYLPSLVVSEVTAGRPLRHALRAVGVCMLAVLILDALQSTFLYLKDVQTGFYRGRLLSLEEKKRLTMFYETLERKDVTDLRERAEKATWMYNGVQPVSDIVRNFFGIIENVLGYLLFGTVISFVSPWLLPLLTLSPLVQIFARKLYNQWDLKTRAERSANDTRLWYALTIPSDFAAGKDIRIYSMAGWLREIVKELTQNDMRWRREEMKHAVWTWLPELFVILIRDSGAYALLISMYLKGGMTIDRFVLYFAAISSFAGWIDGFIRCFNGMRAVTNTICDFRDYVNYPEPKGEVTAYSRDHMEKAPEIRFEQVTYRYPGAEEDTIKNLSFTLRSGEKLALVGLNGAGKTTLVKLLCGLYRPTSGRILIDGAPQTEFDADDYYRLFAPVFQDVRTAFFSLAETVSGRRLEDTDTALAEKCMRGAGLSEKLDSLPDGIFTRLDKRLNRGGAELSGGEKQKLMLARALYKDAPVLVLDEPTAALDPIAESNIYKKYNEMCENKTSVFISHRLASTAFCDRILFLDGGRIAEEGSHRELLKKGGQYAKLFEIQSCWYRDDYKGGAENDAS